MDDPTQSRNFTTLGQRLRGFGRQIVQRYHGPSALPVQPPDHPSATWESLASEPMIWLDDLAPPGESAGPAPEQPSGEGLNWQYAPPARTPAVQRQPDAPRPASPQPPAPPAQRQQDAVHPMLRRIAGEHQQREAERQAVRQQRLADVQRKAVETGKSLLGRRSRAKFDYVETAPLRPDDEQAPITPPPADHADNVQREPEVDEGLGPDDALDFFEAPGPGDESGLPFPAPGLGDAPPVQRQAEPASRRPAVESPRVPQTDAPPARPSSTSDPVVQRQAAPPEPGPASGQGFPSADPFLGPPPGDDLPWSPPDAGVDDVNPPGAVQRMVAAEPPPAPAGKPSEPRTRRSAERTGDRPSDSAPSAIQRQPDSAPTHQSGGRGPAPEAEAPVDAVRGPAADMPVADVPAVDGPYGDTPDVLPAETFAGEVPAPTDAGGPARPVQRRRDDRRNRRQPSEPPPDRVPPVPDEAPSVAHQRPVDVPPTPPDHVRPLAAPELGRPSEPPVQRQPRQDAPPSVGGEDPRLPTGGAWTPFMTDEGGLEAAPPSVEGQPPGAPPRRRGRSRRPSGEVQRSVQPPGEAPGVPPAPDDDAPMDLFQALQAIRQGAGAPTEQPFAPQGTDRPRRESAAPARPGPVQQMPDDRMPPTDDEQEVDVYQALRAMDVVPPDSDPGPDRSQARPPAGQIRPPIQRQRSRTADQPARQPASPPDRGQPPRGKAQSAGPVAAPVQRTITTPSQDGSHPVAPSTEQSQESGGNELDITQLARDVAQLLRERLRKERERFGR